MAALFESISDTIEYMSNYSRSYDYQDLQCQGTTYHYTSTQVFTLPAIILIIIYSFTIGRKAKFLDVLRGRPGFVYPISILTYSDRLSHAASYGVISVLIFRLVFESRQAINYSGTNVIVSALITMVSTLIYGVNCFPIFASVTLRNAVGYGFGTLYIWGFTIANLYAYFDCNMTGTARLVYNLQNVPHYVCLLYLGLRLPYSFIMEIGRWHEEGKFQREKIKQTFFLLRQSYLGRRVTKLLIGVRNIYVPETYTIQGKVNVWCTKMYKKWIYEWDHNFKYSSRILTTMWVGFILLYMITFKVIWSVTSFFLYITDLATYALNAIGWSDVSGEKTEKHLARLLLKVYYYFFGAIWILLILCFSLAFIIGFLGILYSLTSYRENLKALYRGDYKQIRPITCRSNTEHLVGSIRYAGYQIGYIGWAFFIQSAVFAAFVVGIALAGVILFLGYSDWMLRTLTSLGPWLILFVIMIIIQFVMARYVFLQDHEMSLSIDNRRSLYIFTYFLFFYNTFVGIGSCLVRLLRSLITGILLIARLDQSILPRKYELKDPGYERYLGFLHVEAHHTHHCMLVFIDLLKLSQRETKALMLGPSSKLLTQVANTWRAKRKPANRVQDYLVSIFFAKKETGTMKSKGNKIDVVSVDPISATDSKKIPFDEKYPETSTSKPTFNQTKMNKLLSQMKLTVPVSINENSKDTIVPIDEPADVEKSDDHSWDVIRNSPKMTYYRRRQAASFKWFLAYTLMANPQLRAERKGVLQKRLRDAEKGIAGEMTDLNI